MLFEFLTVCASLLFSVCVSGLLQVDGVYDSGVRSGMYVGDGCGRDLRWIQYMTMRSGRCYRRTEVTSAVDMGEPQGTGATLEQMLQALLEDRQRREQELKEERERHAAELCEKREQQEREMSEERRRHDDEMKLLRGLIEKKDERPSCWWRCTTSFT